MEDRPSFDTHASIFLGSCLIPWARN